MIGILVDTGLRVSELVALDWEYLDLDADPGELYLPSEIQARPTWILLMRLAGNFTAIEIECGKTASHYSLHDSLTA